MDAEARAALLRVKAALEAGAPLGAAADPFQERLAQTAAEPNAKAAKARDKGRA